MPPSDGHAGGASHAPHVWIVGVALVLTVGAFSSGLHNGFVYDDQFEIVRNPLIQQDQFFWTALTSDVWAFKGLGVKTWSNYWRPVFVAWMAGNYRMFGLNPVGWHVTSLLAHLAAMVALYWVLVRLAVGPLARAVVTWTFAVHPVQVETVAWASGISNSLMALFLFTSYAAFLRLRDAPTARHWILSLVLYAMALLSKESAVVFPAIVFATDWILARAATSAGKTESRWRIVRCAPYALVALGFVAVRYRILGTMRIDVPGAPGLDGVLLSLPSVAVFYLRQIVWPFDMSPAYPLQVVTRASAGMWNLVVPALILAASVSIVARVARARRDVALGAVWFVATIGLSLDLRNFRPIDLVHDRYLYLPLAGATLMICGLVAAAADRMGIAKQPRWNRLAFVAAGCLAAALAVQTNRYNPVWGDEVRLWERAAQRAPDAPYVQQQLGEALRQAGRTQEARRALDRALAIEPGLTLATISLAALDIDEGVYEPARDRLVRVLAVHPDLSIAIDKLALCLERQGRFDEAITVLENGRRRLPSEHGFYSVNIAVLHVQAGRPSQARQELEENLSALEAAVDAGTIRGLFFLGELRRDQGDAQGARAAYSAFLDRSAALAGDAQIQSMRQAARVRVSSILNDK